MYMKSLKYILMFLVAAVTFTACEEEWAPGTPDTPQSVYFPTDVRSFEVEKTDTSVEFSAYRADAVEALSVAVLAQAVNGKDGSSADALFTLPSAVSFEAGKEETTVTVGFDGAKLEYAVPYVVTIQLKNDENKGQYGKSSISFTVTVPEPWNPIVEGKKGIYRDDFLAPMYGMPAGTMVEVEVVQSALDESKYRMLEPYSQELCPYIIGGVPEDMVYTGPGYVEFIVDENNNVEIPSSPLGFKLDVGRGGPEDFYLATVYADRNTPLYGKFSEGIFWFETPSSIMWHLPDGAGNYANQSGLYAVALPGYEITDYSIAVAYGGMIVAEDNETAKALINFSLGTDVKNYKFTVVEGKVDEADFEAIVKDIVEPADADEDGTPDRKIVEPEDISVLSWTLDLEVGYYTIVAVPYGDEARTDKAVAYDFYFRGMDAIPEAQIKVELGVPSQLVAEEKAEETEEKMPACYYIGVKVTADPSEIKSIKFWYGDSAALEENEITIDELFAEYAGDASVWIDRLEENDGVNVGGFNVVNGVANTVYLRFETIYGYNVDYISEEPYVTPAYDGDMYTGLYTFQDVVGEGEDQEVSQQVFAVVPGKNYNQFLFTHYMIDGTQWYAEYDEEKSTLTVTGSALGYESYGNLYGSPFTYMDEKKTMVYGYYSYASEDSKGDDPMVFTVKDNMLEKLTTTFEMLVHKLDENDNPVELVGTYFSFTPTTTIAPYTLEVGPEAKVMSVSSSKKAASLSCGEALYVGPGVAVDNKCDINAEVYKGEVNRQFVHNATIGF